MKITVISDTHMPRRAKTLPNEVLESIKQSDLLIHAGDFTSIELLHYLQSLTEVIGVAGNNDGPKILIELGRRKIIELGGFRFGIVHGDGYGGSVAKAKREFANDSVDIVIFGHSHQAYHEEEDGIIYFNPGSPTDKRRSPQYSFGELTIDKEIQAKLHFFNNK